MQKNPDSFVYKNQKKLRRGYTTGSCAAGAAKAAAVLLFSGENAEYVSVRTPSGIVLHLRTENPGRTEKEAWCGIRKDAGDDIDATDGILIMARARRIPEPASGKGPDIVIRGGSGVGTVTKIGLDQPVGESAINSVPRRMIREEVGEVLREYHYTGSLAIEISVPDGEKIAEQTFNPRLGIVGGISILGTTGIVEPMSEQALVETIRVEMEQRRQMGEKNLLLAPGNFGLDFIHRQYGISPERAVVCSNFIGDTLDMALHMNFQSVLLVGHIGKLCKLGAGIMNTHSHIADGRMETLCACGIGRAFRRCSCKIAEMLYNGGGTVLSDEKSDMGAGAERPARTDRTADDDARTWENADGCGAFFFRIRISWPDSEGRETD